MSKNLGKLSLRLGLAFLFFYFGIDKFMAVEANVLTFESLWLVSLVPLGVKTMVYLSAVFELVIGVLLLVGWFTRWAGLAAGIWTFLIFTSLGFQAAVYDLALTFMGVSLYFLGPGEYSVDEKAKV